MKLSPPETHPCYNEDKQKNEFPFNLNDDTKVLILGTFPPKKEFQCCECDKDLDFFYYKSRKNQFWKIMQDVCRNWIKNNKNLYLDPSACPECINKNIKLKKKFLCDNNIALVDIFKKIRRKLNNKDEISSNDNEIVPEPDGVIDLKEELQKFKSKDYGITILIPKNVEKFSKEIGIEEIQQEFPNIKIKKLGFSFFPRGKVKLPVKVDGIKKIFKDLGIIK